MPRQNKKIISHLDIIKMLNDSGTILINTLAIKRKYETYENQFQIMTKKIS
jgi:hypothetical protein